MFVFQSCWFITGTPRFPFFSLVTFHLEQKCPSDLGSSDDTFQGKTAMSTGSFWEGAGSNPPLTLVIHRSGLKPWDFATGLDSMFFIEKKNHIFNPHGKTPVGWKRGFEAAGNVTGPTFPRVSLSQTLGFTIPFISLHSNNKTLQVRWANFRVISELTQNSWKWRKNEQFTPRRKPCCLITTSWEDLKVTNLTDPAQQRPRRWARGKEMIQIILNPSFRSNWNWRRLLRRNGKKD